MIRRAKKHNSLALGITVDHPVTWIRVRQGVQGVHRHDHRKALGRRCCQVPGRYLVWSFVLLHAATALLPRLHLAFASHFHQFNPSSHVFEDLRVAGVAPPREFPPDVPATRISEGPSVHAVFVSCTLSNLAFAPFTTSLVPFCLAMAVPVRSESSIVPSWHAAAILSLAPKQSPPIHA